jgi:hypothetical protein
MYTKILLILLLILFFYYYFYPKKIKVDKVNNIMNKVSKSFLKDQKGKHFTEIELMEHIKKKTDFSYCDIKYFLKNFFVEEKTNLKIMKIYGKEVFYKYFY